MRLLLLLLSLGGLFTACQRIELGQSQTPILDQDLPHKTYQTLGNTCQAPDGGLVTILTRMASNQTLRSYTYTSVIGYEVVVIKTDLQGRNQWSRTIAGTAPGPINGRPVIHPLREGGYLVFLMQNTYQSTQNQVPFMIHLTNAGDVSTRAVSKGLTLDWRCPGLAGIVRSGPNDRIC
jgi:hypothetical protein